jgi:hypothetical protein
VTEELLCLRANGGLHRGFGGFELDDAEVVARPALVGVTWMNPMVCPPVGASMPATGKDDVGRRPPSTVQ